MVNTYGELPTRIVRNRAPAPSCATSHVSFFREHMVAGKPGRERDDRLSIHLDEIAVEHGDYHEPSQSEVLHSRGLSS